MIRINLLPLEYRQRGSQLTKGRPSSVYSNDPKKAKVLSEYFGKTITPEIRALINYLGKPNNALELDFALDSIFKKSDFPYPRPKSGSGGSGPVDKDSDGSWGNAVKFFEENTVHDSFLLP